MTKGQGIENNVRGQWHGRQTSYSESTFSFFINNKLHCTYKNCSILTLLSYTCTAECVWQLKLNHYVVWLTSSRPVQPDVTHHISVHVLDFPLFLRVSLQVNQVWTYFPTHNLWIVKGLQTARLCGEKSPVMGVECSAPSGLWGRSSETDRTFLVSLHLTSNN